MGNRRRREELPDEARCTRTGRGWRCHNPRISGRVYCNRHHSLYLARLQTSKATPPPHPRPKRAPPAPPPASSSAAADSLAPSPLSVAPGHVWALPHSPDGLPRAYARVDVVAAADGTAALTPLTATPPPDPNASVPISCGDFLPSGPTMMVKISSLSHRMFPKEKDSEGSQTYTILPRSGEVWAVYNDWDEAEKRFAYRLVEVITDFNEEEGVTAAALAPVEGSDNVLGRHFYEGFELLKSFGRPELAQFSHRVPAVRVDSGGKAGGSPGLWKLVYW